MAVLFSVVVFSAAALAHCAICRMRLPGSSVTKFLAIGGLAGLAFAWELVHRIGASADAASALIVYALMCETYIFLFTMTIGSISANLLIALAHRSMTLAEIDRLYDSRAMVERRIERMISVHLLRCSGDKLFATEKGVRTNRYFAAFRAFFRHSAPDLKRADKHIEIGAKSEH